MRWGTDQTHPTDQGQDEHEPNQRKSGSRAAADGSDAPGRADRLPEVFVGGEGLARGPAHVLATLLHEAAHALAHVRGIKDTPRQGRWHNARFKALAQEVGIEVSKDPKKRVVADRHPHRHEAGVCGGDRRAGASVAPVSVGRDHRRREDQEAGPGGAVRVRTQHPGLAQDLGLGPDPVWGLRRRIHHPGRRQRMTARRVRTGERASRLGYGCGALPRPRADPLTIRSLEEHVRRLRRRTWPAAPAWHPSAPPPARAAVPDPSTRPCTVEGGFHSPGSAYISPVARGAAPTRVHLPLCTGRRWISRGTCAAGSRPVSCAAASSAGCWPARRGNRR
jgi:hypothetical protein